MIFHGDRFNRAGDHLSFFTQGYAAVRLTTPRENYENQHSATNTFANTSVPYAARVAKMNAAVLASLALAPAPPVVKWTFLSGDRKGDRLPLLSRGKSGYERMRWQPGSLNRYHRLCGHSSAPPQRPIGSARSGLATRPAMCSAASPIDDVVIGVKAVDHDGNQSMVSALPGARVSTVNRPAPRTGRGQQVKIHSLYKSVTNMLPQHQYRVLT